jgi:2-polyprenyl-3-methyl-5-hydroxy-6-metoxy-1,4-benzoquinol methylase
VEIASQGQREALRGPTVRSVLMPTGVPSELFDDDYLYFYSDVLGPQRSDADAALISELLSLGPGMRVLDAPCGEGRISGRLAQRGCRRRRRHQGR